MPGHFGQIRSLPIDQWPEADRSAWMDACRPAERLRRGGAASHLREITQRDLARRYGYFLDHVQRSEGIDRNAEVATYVTPDRVSRFVAELQARVGSVTMYGSIYKLRRTAQLLAPWRDLSWLTEIEKDLELVMQPKTKFHRLIYSHVLLEAGLTLMAEVDSSTNWSALARARQFRNGLMVALLALHMIRLKNFAALEMGRTFRQVNGAWWIVLPALETKEKRADERPVDPCLTRWIDQYLAVQRPVLARTDAPPPALWLSCNDGKAMSCSGVARVISQTTLATVGIDLSPHLFRVGGASTAAVYAGGIPRLASALLHHTDPVVTEEYYNRADGLSAAQAYAALIRGFRNRD